MSSTASCSGVLSTAGVLFIYLVLFSALLNMFILLLFKNFNNYFWSDFYFNFFFYFNSFCRFIIVFSFLTFYYCICKRYRRFTKVLAKQQNGDLLLEQAKLCTARAIFSHWKIRYESRVQRRQSNEIADTHNTGIIYQTICLLLFRNNRLQLQLFRC